jgi:hypothetical protein
MPQNNLTGKKVGFAFMADQRQFFSFLSLTDSESRQIRMSGILTMETHEKRPMQGIKSRGLSSCWTQGR